MSRSGYSDDCDDNSCWLWMGAVKRAINGKRGQAALRGILEALDAMPVKELHGGTFQRGGQCTLGAYAAHRGIEVSDLEPVEDPNWGPEVDREKVGRRFNIAMTMAAEIMYQNDEGAYYPETPAARWQRMRAWVAQQLKEATP